MVRNVAVDAETLLQLLGDNAQIRICLDGPNMRVLYEWKDQQGRTLVSSSSIARRYLSLDYGSILGEVIDRFRWNLKQGKATIVDQGTQT